MKLNLPEFNHNVHLRNHKYYIWDIIRKKYVFLTPEEWVRQHFIHYLVSKSYPKGLIRIEKSFSNNNLQKRCDIVCYTKNGNPFLLVECKSYYAKLIETTLWQAMNYNTIIEAPYIAITNGIRSFYWHIDLYEKICNPIKGLPLFQKDL